MMMWRAQLGGARRRHVCGRERGSDGACAARRGAAMWHTQLGGRDNEVHVAARGVAMGHAQLGGAWQRGAYDWEGHDDEAHAAGRGTARWGHVSVVAVSSRAW
jgi:hypothetical protein